jgi:hypothetical protein
MPLALTRSVKRFREGWVGFSSRDGPLTVTLQRGPDQTQVKGYVTNIPGMLMPAAEVISSYHDLWHVEECQPHCTRRRATAA